MIHWPLALRILLAAVVFAPTIWAFANGHMLLAVIGVAACAWVFHRLFLSGLG